MTFCPEAEKSGAIRMDIKTQIINLAGDCYRVGNHNPEAVIN